ncbi:MULTISPECIES: DUF5627 domain-containing protein [Bacteroidaceae]|uniref:DUF5627 domain-containing protein n=1 Tax=Bacteroidaceae TaxID=815 RepID=UPI00195C3427|nr:DUF5627 domain-containing protein [Bacteroides gallinaceum]MBM6659217.1 DUF1735 domain-containing protein [Bacteroides gallinaceum]
MRKANLYSILLAGITAMGITSCENGDAEFPNYDNSAVYFAHQTPVRTLVMGEDTYDTSLDNAHKCKIYATMGGAYAGSGSTVIDIMVDNELCDNLYFADGVTPVRPMPANYYTLSSEQITLNEFENLMGAVEVTFNNEFFEDPASTENTYVIPLRMVNVVNADSILSGVPRTPNAAWTNSAMWDTAPKNYVLYCVKYINKWHATYLRRGIDQITENGSTTTNVRHEQYIEDDEICNVTTKDLHTAIFPVSTTVGQETLTCDLVLTFNDNDECTITSGTEGFTASGSGKFVIDGDKASWGNEEDRNALYLDYNVDFGTKQYVTKDTLVVQTRGVAYEEFSTVYKE